MDYRKSWEDAEAEMLQTQRINRQYAARSGVTKPTASSKTDTKKNTRQTNSADTSSSRGKTSNTRQNSAKNSSDSERKQSIHKNGSSWYNTTDTWLRDIHESGSSWYDATDTWLRDIHRRMGVSEDSGITKTSFAGSVSSTKSNASSAAAKSSVKHASDFTNYVNDAIKSTAKNSTDPSPLDFGRYGAVGNGAKNLTNDLAARIALLKPKDRPTPDEMDFMSGFMSGDEHFIRQNEALKRSFWNSPDTKSPAPSVGKQEPPAPPQPYVVSEPPSDPAEIQILKKVEQEAKELFPPPRETNPKRDLEEELALRKRLAPIDPTLMDPSVVDPIYQALDTIKNLENADRETLIKGENYIPEPTKYSDNIGTEVVTSDILDWVLTEEQKGQADAVERAVTDLLTDEQKRAIAAGGDVLDILDASGEDVQYQLGALGDTFLKNLSPEQKHAILFLGSDLFSDIPLGTRERIWSVLHGSAGKITAQELIQLGVFGKEDLDRAKNAALLTEAEYRSTAFGETMQYFQAKNDAERFAQLTGLLSTPYVDLVEELFHGKNTKTFGNGKFDRLDQSTGGQYETFVPPESFLSQDNSDATINSMKIVVGADGKSYMVPKDLKVSKGKIGGKIPVIDYFDLKRASVQNKGCDSITLGKFKDDDTSYTKRAGKNSSYFDMGLNWNAAMDKYNLTEDELFKYFNISFLEDSIKNGKTIRFSHNPVGDKKSLGKEWAYIKKRLNLSDDDLYRKGGFWYVK